jgi:hypothetical protein
VELNPNDFNMLIFQFMVPVVAIFLAAACRERTTGLRKVSTIELVKYVPPVAYKAVTEGNKRERLEWFLGRISSLVAALRH